LQQLSIINCGYNKIGFFVTVMGTPTDMATMLEWLALDSNEESMNKKEKQNAMERSTTKR
jgi:hypothetical protein